MDEATTTYTPEDACVGIVNTILRQIKVPVQIESINECVPSLWVALYEGLFETRLHNIDRSANTLQAKTDNVRMVLTALETNVLKTDLAHISPQGIVEKNLEDVLNLTELFGEIAVSLRDAETGASITTGSASNTESDSKEDIIEDVTKVDQDTTEEEEEGQGSPRARLDKGKERDLSGIDAEDVGEVVEYGFSADEESLVKDLDQENTEEEGSVSPRKRHRRTWSGDQSGSLPAIPKNDIEEYIDEQEEKSRSMSREVSKESQSVREQEEMESSTNSTTPPPAETTTTIDQPSELAQTQSASASTSHRSKRTKLNTLKSVYTTPKALKPTESDSPHTKFLKKERARLLRENQTQQRRLKSLPASPYRPVNSTTQRGQHIYLSGNNAKRGATSMTSSALKSRDMNLSVLDPISFVSRTSSSSTVTKPPPTSTKSTSKTISSIAEDNLRTLTAKIKETIPSVTIPKRLERKVWNDQLFTWRKALEAKKWDRKVLGKKMEELEGKNVLAMEDYEKQLEREVELERKSATDRAAREAKSHLMERYRHVKKMEVRQAEIEKEVEGWRVRKQARDEKFVKEIYDKYVEEQRQLIIETRRDRKEAISKAMQQKISKQEADIHFYKDQCAMLKEQLEESRREEEIVRKAQAEAARQQIRDQKIAAKKAIDSLKEKLKGDEGNFDGFFRELEKNMVVGKMNVKSSKR